MNRTWQKISFFGVLYFLQGAAFAYAVNFQKPYLTMRGLDKGTIGFFTALLLIPFIGKIFLGMLSDRVPIGRFGSRKPYMLLGLSIFAVCYAWLAAVDPAARFIEFVALSFAASIGLALFDTCCDGWAVDVSRVEEQGAVQAAMVAGRSLGLIAAALLFGLVAELHGYHGIFYVLAAMAAIVWCVVLALAHVPLGGGQLEHTAQASWGDFRELRSKAYLIFALYGVWYSISSFGTDGLLTLHLADTRLANAMDLGLFGTCRGVGALMGAWMLASYLKQLPLERVVRSALLALGAGCLLPLFNLPVNFLGALWGLAWGFQETAFVTLAMSYARGPWAATYFAIFMIFSNMGTMVGEAVGGIGVQNFGYNLVFMGFAALAWLGAIALPRSLTQKL
jgi:PAT family beta-lactamase induction signal transducer AmpG